MTDRGYYDSAEGVFYPKDENETVSASYIEENKQKVRDKMTVSRNFVNTDFYELYSQYLITPERRNTFE